VVTDARPRRRGASAGSLFAIACGLSYSVTVVVGGWLADRGVPSATALGLRFGIAAAFLLLLQAARRGPLLPAPGERLAAFLLGAVGYGIESTCFYAGLEHGSAAAVGLLFYSYPAVVTAIELVLGSIRATPRLIGALALSLVGVAVVIGAGGSVTITPLGALFACLASVTFSIYFLCSHAFVRRTPSQVAAIWVSAGAAVSMLVRGAATSTLEVPHGVWWQVLAYAAANCVAFSMMFAALRRLGPSRTSVLLTVEVLGTVVLAAVFLNETLRPAQLLGGAAIAAGAVIAALAHQTAADALDAAPP
jgi:drug/metabolite transporter (DMT)-like permease